MHGPIPSARNGRIAAALCFGSQRLEQVSVIRSLSPGTHAVAQSRQGRLNAATRLDQGQWGTKVVHVRLPGLATPIRTNDRKTILLLTAATTFGLVLGAPAFAASKDLPGIYSGEAISTVDRRKPRVPGGSGCDDPRDLIEHPEYRR